MNAKEQQEFADFVDAHSGCLCGVPKMAFPHRQKLRQVVEMQVTQTGIAPAYTVTCRKCGEKKDIADYDSW